MNNKLYFCYSVHCTVRKINIKHKNLSKFYLPSDAQLNCLKNNFKIYIKIDIKTAPTCFRVITIIRECIIRSC